MKYHGFDDLLNSIGVTPQQSGSEIEISINQVVLSEINFKQEREYWLMVAAINLKS